MSVVATAMTFSMKAAVSAEPAIASSQSVLSTTKSAIAAVEAAAAMGITAAVEVVATIETAEAIVSAKLPAATEVAVVIAAEVVSATEIPPSVVATKAPAVVAAEVAPTVAIAEVPPAIVVVEIDPGGIVEIKVAAAIELRAIKSAEPWPRADENAADEPLRPVIAIGRARIRRIGIVAVWADRGRTYVDGPTNSNSDSNTHLRVGGARHCPGQRDNKPSHCGVFKDSHFGTSPPELFLLRHTPVHKARDMPEAPGPAKQT